MPLVSIDLYMLPAALRQTVEQELNTDKTILWINQPKTSRFVRKSLPIVLFAIPFLGFAIFWTVMASGMTRSAPGGWNLFGLFGIPFILVGLGLFTSPFWMRRKAKRTVYVITDRRAILISGGMSLRIHSYYPDKLGSLERVQHADGTGDIIFERRVSHGHKGHTYFTPVGFLAVESAREVQQLLEDLALASGADSPAQHA